MVNDLTFDDFETFVTTETGRVSAGCVGCDGPGITRTVRLDEWPCRFSYDFDYPVWRDPVVVYAVEAGWISGDCGHGEERV